MLKAVFFDLDGTLLPLDEEAFTNVYFHLLYEKVKSIGYEKDKLINTIWQGTKKMYANDGSTSNEEVFWNEFKRVYGEEKINDKKLFDEFYSNEFKKLKAICQDNFYAREIIDFCHKNGLDTYLTTNPIFPLEGTKTRMSFINLTVDDFNLVTSYENSSYTKPNPKYFSKILKDYNLNPNEVILFGNNTLEDGDCAYECGIKCFLVGDFIIENPKSKHYYPRIRMDEVIPMIIEEIEDRKNA